MFKYFARAKVYSCRKCGMMIESNSQPSSVGCPAGGCHSWSVTYYNF